MQSLKKLVIFGLGETAELAFEYFSHDPNYKEYEIVGFCADSQYIKAETFCKLPVVNMDEVNKKFPPSEFAGFVAAASGRLNRDRSALYARVKGLGYILASYVSSRAFVWRNVEIGENCFILEDNTLQPFTKIGNNVTLWSGNHIGHRTVIQDHCFITSHVVISGFCTIGSHSFVGVNACFADKVKVAADNFIAMGAVINKNTVENGFYAGNPMELKKVSAKRFCGVEEQHGLA